MADHIFGFGKKVITESGGTLYDSGGPEGPYNANEEDYFVIRRTAAEYAAEQYFILTFAEWSVADRNVVSTDYDYIDVYRNNGTARNPSSWTWIERIGGDDLKGAAVVATFHLSARNIKFVFRSSYRQTYSYNGFRLNFSTSNSTSGTDLTGVGSTTYSDESNLKENAGDSKTDVTEGILAETVGTADDPGKDNWDFLPAGQFETEGENGIHILNYELTNLNFTRSGLKIPLSYAQPERSFTKYNSTNVSNITKELD
tara:strand:+ start:13 stop:783 length:771 start_codon:yes stop_codon:yes gene_type:complete